MLVETNFLLFTKLVVKGLFKKNQVNSGDEGQDALGFRRGEDFH